MRERANSQPWKLCIEGMAGNQGVGLFNNTIMYINILLFMVFTSILFRTPAPYSIGTFLYILRANFSQYGIRFKGLPSENFFYNYWEDALRPLDNSEQCWVYSQWWWKINKNVNIFYLKPLSRNRLYWGNGPRFESGNYITLQKNREFGL